MLYKLSHYSKIHMHLFISLIAASNANLQSQIKYNTNILFQYGSMHKGTVMEQADKYGCQSLYNFFDKIKVCNMPVDRHYIKFIVGLGYPEEQDAKGIPVQLRIFDIWEKNIKSIRDIVLYDQEMFMSGEKPYKPKVQDYTVRESSIDEYHLYLKKKIEYKFLSRCL